MVIAGGASGIGLATAKLLLDHGARVMVTAHTEATLDSTREELGTNATWVKSDATSLTNIDTLAARVKSEFETLDALLICAGQTRFVPFQDVTEAVYDESLAVKTKGAYFTAQKLAPLMTEGSAVVFITSVANVLGIAANVVTPGAIETDFGGGHVRDNPEIKDQIGGLTTLGRVGLPDDIGGVVPFSARKRPNG